MDPEQYERFLERTYDEAEEERNYQRQQMCPHTNMEEGVALESPHPDGHFAIGNVCPDCGKTTETGTDSVL